MAKKINRKSIKKPTRCSSMERTIQEGNEYLESNKKKRITKTRTMVQTIKDSKTVSVPSKKVQKKRGRKAKPQKRLTKPAKPSVPAKVSKLKVPGPSSSLPSASLPVPALARTLTAKSASKASIKADNVPTKVTKFKTKSKQNLPLSAFGYIDVCFCVDATGSMSGELAQVQSTIVQIIKKIQTKVATEGILLRFAVVTYRDHPPQQTSYVTQIKDFTDDHQIIDYVNKLQASGGGDQPEAVHDGLLDCCQKLRWVQIPGTPLLRYIFHIADAPPHGKQFTTYQSQQGCLCGLQTKDIVHAINIKQIHYRLIKVRTNQRVDAMQKIFKKQIVDFDSVDIVNAKQMDVRISDMIIHQILPDHY